MRKFFDPYFLKAFFKGFGEPQILEESFGNQENYAYFAARLNYESSEDEDWEFEGEPINNIFDILSDETD